MNTIKYTLTASLPDNPSHLFLQKQHDSEKDGFEFDDHFGAVNRSTLCVVKTNQNHIFCESFSYKNFKCVSDIGCLIQSPIKTIPIVYGQCNNMYHFQNDFEANRKKKLSDIVSKYSQLRRSIDGKKVIDIPLTAINMNELYISDFEIFS